MADGTLWAWLAVSRALQALIVDARSVAVVAAVDQASAAVRDLPPSHTAQVLRGVLVEIDWCQRTGLSTSRRLRAAMADAVLLLAVQSVHDPPCSPPDHPGSW